MCFCGQHMDYFIAANYFRCKDAAAACNSARPEHRGRNLFDGKERKAKRFQNHRNNCRNCGSLLSTKMAWLEKIKDWLKKLWEHIKKCCC